MLSTSVYKLLHKYCSVLVSLINFVTSSTLKMQLCTNSFVFAHSLAKKITINN